MFKPKDKPWLQFTLKYVFLFIQYYQITIKFLLCTFGAAIANFYCCIKLLANS